MAAVLPKPCPAREFRRVNFRATKALPIRDVLVTQQVGDAAQDHDPVLVVGPLLVSRFGCIEARWSQVRMLVARRSRTFHLW